MYEIPKKSSDSGLWSGVGLLVGVAALILYRPYVLAMGWAWHAVPLGLPALSYGQVWLALCTYWFVTSASVDSASVTKARATPVETLLTALVSALLMHGLFWWTAP